MNYAYKLTDREFESKRSLRPFLKRIFSHAFFYKRWVSLLAVNIIIVAMIDAIFPLLWLHYIDNVVTPLVEEFKIAGSFTMTDLAWHRILEYAGIYLLVTVINIVCVGFFIFYAGNIQEHVMFDLRNAMFNKLQKLSFKFYDRSAIGWLISRVSSDTDRVCELISWGFLELIWGCTIIIMCFAVMFFYSWKLSLVVLITLPLLLLVSVKIRLLILKYSRQARKLNSDITATVNEHINGIELNKSMVQEENASAEFKGLTERMRWSSFRSSYYSAMYAPVVVAVGSIAAAGIIFFGGHLALETSTGITLGILAAFFAYARFIFEPIFDITRFYALAQDSLSAGERIFSLLDEKVDIADKLGSKDFHSIKGEIEFRNVDFKYVEDKPILKNFNLNIKEGESVALVGPTGEGKTTIANLLSRFYEPQNGVILVDGIDLRSRTLKSYQKQIGIIMQTPHLFSGTVEENAKYASPEISNEEVKKALTIIGAGDFIPRLKDEVREEGENLSTGEKQVLSFARVMLMDPRILIMDEATSSIDTLAERKIQKGIDYLIKGRTSIIIAHRLSTIKSCDRILVIKEGRISEEGNHDNLMRQKGYYYKLYAKQVR